MILMYSIFRDAFYVTFLNLITNNFFGSISMFCDILFISPFIYPFILSQKSIFLHIWISFSSLCLSILSTDQHIQYTFFCNFVLTYGCSSFLIEFILIEFFNRKFDVYTHTNTHTHIHTYIRLHLHGYMHIHSVYYTQTITYLFIL